MKSVQILIILAILLPGFSCKKDNPAKGTDKWGKVIVTTLAGEGTPSDEDGPFLSAKFNAPGDLVFSIDGPLYVTDIENHQIREIKGGQVSGFAGSDSAGIVNGQGKTARFIAPYSITTDAEGNLYISDLEDPRIRKITPDGLVSFYAGSAREGFNDGNADSAQFYNGNMIVADDQENIYVADARNNRIRKISNTGLVTTIAGNGEAGFREGSGAVAEFNNPGGITRDRSGNIYVMDRKNFRIRKITPDGEVSTFAGSGKPGRTDGKAELAGFSGNTHDMVIDSNGDIFFEDDHRIRMVSSSGVVSTIAGSTSGYEDGDCNTAKFNLPTGLCVDILGNVFVSDLGNNRIREIIFK